MNTVQRIAKNMMVLFLARIVSILFGFFYVMYTARYLGPANYGILSFALALNGIFRVITNFGLDPLTVREVARDKSLARRYLANGIVLKLIFGTLTFLIVALVVNFLRYPGLTRRVVYIITFSTIVTGINNLFNDIYQAFERMEFISIGQILQSVLSLVFAIVAIKLGMDVLYFAMIYLIANLITLGYHIVIMTWKFLKPKIEIDLRFWKSVVKEAWQFALMTIFVSIYYWMDSVMLSYMKGDKVVGWYSAAYNVILLVLVISQIYFTAIFPNLSRHYKNTQTFNYIYYKSLIYMAFIAFPLGILTTLLSEKIILAIYKEAYLPASLALKVLIWADVCIFISLNFGYVFNALNRQDIATKATGIGALVNVVLNLILIPKYSLVGAAVATVITEFIVLIVEGAVIVRYIPFDPVIGDILKIVFVNLASFAILELVIPEIKFPSPFLNIITVVVTYGAIYISLSTLLKVLKGDDWRLIKKIINYK